MAEIEEQFYNIWKQMSLNESMSTMERAKLAVWDYPVSDKYTNVRIFVCSFKMLIFFDVEIYARVQAS
jgi:ionotropic glutamate receptor